MFWALGMRAGATLDPGGLGQTLVVVQSCNPNGAPGATPTGVPQTPHPPPGGLVGARRAIAHKWPSVPGARWLVLGLQEGPQRAQQLALLVSLGQSMGGQHGGPPTCGVASSGCGPAGARAATPARWPPAAGACSAAAAPG